MRIFALLILFLVALPAPAADVQLASAWSGLWADASGQYTCSLHVTANRLRMLCQLGRAGGGVVDLSPVPVTGTEIPLARPLSEFGALPAGVQGWGVIAVFPICAIGTPLLHIAVLGPAGSGAVAELYPVGMATSPCAQIGGAR